MICATLSTIGYKLFCLNLNVMVKYNQNMKFTKDQSRLNRGQVKHVAKLTKSEQLKKKAKEFFKANKIVKCPAFPNEKIFFNAKGLQHLFYKGPRSKRDLRRIAKNIELLPRAVKLLELMPIPQEEDTYTTHEKKYNFWAFEGVVDKRRIKVIVRQVGTGKKHFYSVIPAWRKKRFGVLNSKTRLWRN